MNSPRLFNFLHHVWWKGIHHLLTKVSYTKPFDLHTSIFPPRPQPIPPAVVSFCYLPRPLSHHQPHDHTDEDWTMLSCFAMELL
jgi:hypothetical protein